MRLFQVLEMRRVWDVTALFRFAVSFTIGVTGAGGDHAGAWAFLDDVVDHDAVSLSLSRTLNTPCLRGFLYAFDCITVGAVSAIGVLFASWYCMLHPVWLIVFRRGVSVRVFSGG